MSKRISSPLYAILDVDCTVSSGLAPLDVLDQWLGAGVSLVQLRAKTLAGGDLLAIAEEAVARCRAAGAMCIINDRADVAAMAGASGVHVGQDDLSAQDARRVVGPGAWVGVSTHTDEQLAAACREPIDYVAIGPVFSTSTKHQPDPVVGLEGVRRAAPVARAAGLPLVAIGGITLASAPAVLAAGADAVAVISDLLAGDPAVRARQYLAV